MIRFALLIPFIIGCMDLTGPDASSDRRGAGEIQVSPLFGEALQVSVGDHSTCALFIDGQVHCWVPTGHFDWAGITDVPDMTNATAISNGYGHACAIDENEVKCWGASSSGQSTVPPLVNPRFIAAGTGNTCAIDDTGVVCWGSWQSIYPSTIVVPPLSNPTAVAINYDHACAIDDSGVVCWGQPGNSAWKRQIPSTNPISIAVGWGSDTCVVDDHGLECYGPGADFLRERMPVLSNPKQVSFFMAHVCAIDDSGAKCWGDNMYGRIDLPEIKNLRGLSAGPYHTCVIDGSEIKCTE